MNLIPFAFAFPCWNCRECHTEVHWHDAEIEEESGKLVAVRHESCASGVGGNQ